MQMLTVQSSCKKQYTCKFFVLLFHDIKIVKLNSCGKQLFLCIFLCEKVMNVMCDLLWCFPPLTGHGGWKILWKQQSEKCGVNERGGVSQHIWAGDWKQWFTSTVPVKRSCREGQRAGKPLALGTSNCPWAHPFLPQGHGVCFSGALPCSPAGICYSSRMWCCSGCCFPFLASATMERQLQTQPDFSDSFFLQFGLMRSQQAVLPPHPGLVLRRQLPPFVVQNETTS